MKVKWSEENYNLVFASMMFFLAAYLIFNFAYLFSLVLVVLGFWGVSKINLDGYSVTVNSSQSPICGYPQGVFLLLTALILVGANARISTFLTWLLAATIIATAVFVFRPKGEYAADEIKRVICFIIPFVILYVIAINREDILIYPLTNVVSFVCGFVVVAGLGLLYIMVCSVFLDEISLVLIDSWNPFLKSPTGVVYTVSVLSLGAMVLVSFIK